MESEKLKQIIPLADKKNIKSAWILAKNRAWSEKSSLEYAASSEGDGYWVKDEVNL